MSHNKLDPPHLRSTNLHFFNFNYNIMILFFNLSSHHAAYSNNPEVKSTWYELGVESQ